ncbi:cysteine protease ATG4C [Pyxicephalus adspersus]|uniref:cysteine protease ATG4C n=1 Tax=Pyxicephalus adspersus TaxID=30357 RepID=UPI003B5C6CE7
MEASASDDVDKLKSRFLSAWNNVKYSWVLKTRTYFRRNSPVFLLGKCYHFKLEVSNETFPNDLETKTEANGEVVFGTVEEFRKDFISRVWLTYREDFPQLEGSTLTTDCGWGCTLRTGQMLLAQGLLVHFIGRDWLWPNALDIYSSDVDFWSVSSARKLAPLEAAYVDHMSYGTNSSKSLHIIDCDEKNQTEFYHRKIISWFADHPLADFGIHPLIKFGKSSGKVAGDWYGPAIVSHILRKAIEESVDPEVQGITIYVAQDCTIYNGDVYDKQNNSDSEKSVLILVPVRLGGERTNIEYFEFVKGILSLEYCIGIIGGRPKQSYYFVGFQGFNSSRHKDMLRITFQCKVPVKASDMVYHRPLSYKCVLLSFSSFCCIFDVACVFLQSFHCPSPKKMPFRKMDPSCTIGFYCRNAQDFVKVEEELTKVLKSSSKRNYPLFTFVNGHAQDFDFACSPMF